LAQKRGMRGEKHQKIMPQKIPSQGTTVGGDLQKAKKKAKKEEEQPTSSGKMGSTK